MSEADKLKRRFPKVLADELHFAFHAVRDLGPQRVLELLTNYRQNRAKRIATWGILNTDAPVQGLKSIPAELCAAIARLDEAFCKLHAYRNSGAEDYAAADVESAINSFRARGSRSRSNEYEEICKWLRRRGYEQSDDKADLVSQAMDAFGTGESTVRRALHRCGMTRKKKGTAT